MEILFTYHDRILSQVPGSFFRFLYGRINWNQRMLAITGPRGAGKTTLMLQYLKFELGNQPGNALYISADHHWFYTHSLAETVELFYQNGGRYLFIDEVHKYPRWSRELKNIYDGYPELRVVFSASSALDLYRGEADLSRRVITYDLPGMSFREYLSLMDIVHMPAIEFTDIVNDHRSLSGEITRKIHPLPYFRKYCMHGYLPIIKESLEDEVPVRIEKIINTIIDSDLSYTEGYRASTAIKVKKLIGALAESAPFKPNISSLARKLDVSRDSIYAWLNHLEKARLFNLLVAQNKGVSALQKPDKIYLENPNLNYVIRNNPEIGTIRETFLLNQLKNSNQQVYLPKRGDFLVDDVIIEVGGKSKTAEQLQIQASFIIAADDIERGFDNKIPLWLFGFLY